MARFAKIGHLFPPPFPGEELKAKPEGKPASVLHQSGRVVLGVLILWQLFYLAVANGVETLQVVTRRSPNTNQRIVEVVDASRSGENASSIPALSKLIYVVDKWGQVAQQPQRWSLFAPNVGKQTGFLALEFKWKTLDESLWWYSEDEPENPASYLRSGGNRFRSVEQNLVITFSRSGDESEQNARERWGRQIKQKLAIDCDSLMTWVGIRLADFQRQHPHVPTPDEIVIHSRGYEIPAPDQVDRWEDDAPYCIAIARWRPTVEVAQGVLPIEAFDPDQNRFVYQPYATETAQ